MDVSSIPQSQIDQIKKRDLSHRVVQTEQMQKKIPPDQTAFLGAQDQMVDRQTVSKHHQIHDGKSGSMNEVSSKQQGVKKRNSLAFKSLGLPILSHERLNSQNDGSKPEWATPSLRPQDYISGIAESDRTALNTKEFVFYSYFQRIRAQLDRAWNPILRQKLIAIYKQGRALASDREHQTEVLVILNESGEIVKVQIVGESGLLDLDDAAVEAFNKAGPFPNPPRGMADQNREIKISWDFILKT